mmetsp:Transcript_14125/g.29578  ORF Transcript_14125/g.29578 Transcript_14125/m.29578 type:complete len:257 (+) Transcript_14125:499-1269(+)
MQQVMPRLLATAQLGKALAPAEESLHTMLVDIEQDLRELPFRRLPLALPGEDKAPIQQQGLLALSNAGVCGHRLLVLLAWHRVLGFDYVQERGAPIIVIASAQDAAPLQHGVAPLAQLIGPFYSLVSLEAELAFATAAYCGHLETPTPPLRWSGLLVHVSECVLATTQNLANLTHLQAPPGCDLEPPGQLRPANGGFPQRLSCLGAVSDLLAINKPGSMPRTPHQEGQLDKTIAEDGGLFPLQAAGALCAAGAAAR